MCIRDRASPKNGKILINLDDYFNPVALIVSREVAEKIRAQLQESNEEKTNEMYEEELLSKDERIEELENIIAQYEENLDAYKEKLIKMCIRDRSKGDSLFGISP